MKFTTIILFLIITFLSFGVKSQTDEKNLNHYIKYLNAQWKEVQDKSDAVYMMYDYPDEKARPKEIFYSSKHRLEYNPINKIAPKEGIIILNGECKWYDKKGNLLTHDKFIDGERIWGRNYMWGLFGKKCTGKKIHEYFNYKKKYNDQPYSFYCVLYDKKGNKTMWFYRNGKKGYKYYPTD